MDNTPIDWRLRSESIRQRRTRDGSFGRCCSSVVALFHCPQAPCDRRRPHDRDRRDKNGKLRSFTWSSPVVDPPHSAGTASPKVCCRSLPEYRFPPAPVRQAREEVASLREWDRLCRAAETWTSGIGGNGRGREFGVMRRPVREPGNNRAVFARLTLLDPWFRRWRFFAAFDKRRRIPRRFLGVVPWNSAVCRARKKRLVYPCPHCTTHFWVAVNPFVGNFLRVGFPHYGEASNAPD